MTVKEAIEITGGLSKTEKMPGYSYSLPPSSCKRGSVLCRQEGTICSHCYARRGRYRFKPVRAALQRRLESLKHPRWKEAMAFLINTQDKSGYFRWHDSGDLQGLRHLKNIIWVCEHTPLTKHWLPTRERAILDAYVGVDGECTENLTVRVSSDMVDEIGPKGYKCVSSVHSGHGRVACTDTRAYFCPASKQGNKCLKCRACWYRDVHHVSYPLK